MGLPEQWLRLAPKPRALQGQEKWHVFLSYRSVNRIWVLNLYDVLRQQGCNVFLDQVVLKGGDELILKLQEGLRLSQAGILVWSASAADSPWVAREYQTLENLALKRPAFSFVPIVIEKFELPEFAANRVHLDFSTYPDGPNGGELLRLLHAIAGQPLSEEAARFAAQQDEVAKQTAAAIKAAVKINNPPRLLELFNNGGSAWETSSALGCLAADGLVKLEHVDEAIQMLLTLEQKFPKAIRPKQLRALALSRRNKDGDRQSAQLILSELYESGERDPETLGIFGRTWMDRFTTSGNRLDLEQSRDLYAQAFELATDDYYTGINAASKSVFLGTPDDLRKADAYAARVQAIVGTEPIADDYWKTATVGEVFLLRKDYQNAARLYKAAVRMASTQTGSHKSTWTQARRLMEKLGPSDEERGLIDTAFAHLQEP